MRLHIMARVKLARVGLGSGWAWLGLARIGSSWHGVARVGSGWLGFGWVGILYIVGQHFRTELLTGYST